MTELIRDSLVVAGSPDALWALLEDTAALERVIPGAERIERLDATHFRAVLVSRIQFVSIRADADATLTEIQRPAHVRLELNGRPRGLVGTFRVSIPCDIEPARDASGNTSSTRITYTVDLTVTGRLATFGTPLLRATFRQQVAELLRNLDQELAARAA